jgi:hypothetical protein
MLQLDLFEKNEVVLILKELNKIKQSNDSVRKKIFSLFSDHQKEVKQLKETLLLSLKETMSKETE